MNVNLYQNNDKNMVFHSNPAIGRGYLCDDIVLHLFCITCLNAWVWCLSQGRVKRKGHGRGLRPASVNQSTVHPLWVSYERDRLLTDQAPQKDPRGENAHEARPVTTTTIHNLILNYLIITAATNTNDIAFFVLLLFLITDSWGALSRSMTRSRQSYLKLCRWVIHGLAILQILNLRILKP